MSGSEATSRDKSGSPLETLGRGFSLGEHLGASGVVTIAVPPDHKAALRTQIKLPRIPSRSTVWLIRTLLAPLKLHREVLQHLVEREATPKFTLVSGQSAEHFLVIRCPASLPEWGKGVKKGELGFRIVPAELSRGGGFVISVIFRTAIKAVLPGLRMVGMGWRGPVDLGMEIPCISWG